MTTVRQAIRENDAVELLDAVDKIDGDGSWPAGTIGAVVSERGTLKLIEICDELGVPLDYVSVAADRLALRG